MRRPWWCLEAEFGDLRLEEIWRRVHLGRSLEELLALG
jgi:hypothetical protein